MGSKKHTEKHFAFIKIHQKVLFKKIKLAISLNFHCNLYQQSVSFFCTYHEASSFEIYKGIDFIGKWIMCIIRNIKVIYHGFFVGKQIYHFQVNIKGWKILIMMNFYSEFIVFFV